MKPYLWDGIVGGQRKNQSPRGATFATARRYPFKFLRKVTELWIKKRALSIVSNAAAIYDNYLCNHNLLLILGNPSTPSFIETKAEDKNFLHLTGFVLNKSSLLKDVNDKKSNLASIFYEKLLNKRINMSDFEFKDRNTEQKLNILINTLNVSSSVKMVGDYSGYRINLKTDKVAGNVNSFLGFIKTGKYYTPNTAMADDIRKNTGYTQKVLAILSKKIDEPEYNRILSVGKKIKIVPLLEKVSSSVKIDKSLLESTPTKQAEQSEKETNSTKHISDTTIDNKPQQDEILKKCICDKIMNNNPLLKHKLNIAAKEYFKKNNLSELPQNASVEERNQMRERVLNANPDLLNEYINAQKALEQSANNFTNDKPKVNENNVVEPTQTLPKKPKHKR